MDPKSAQEASKLEKEAMARYEERATHEQDLYDVAYLTPYDPPPVYGESMAFLPAGPVPAYSGGDQAPPQYSQVAITASVTTSSMGVFTSDSSVNSNSQELLRFIEHYSCFPPGLSIFIKGDPIDQSAIGNRDKEEKARLRGYFKADFAYKIDASNFINPSAGQMIVDEVQHEQKDDKNPITVDSLMNDFIRANDKEKRITVRKCLSNFDAALLTKCIQGYFRGKLGYQGVITVHYNLDNYKIVVGKSKKSVEKIYTPEELRDMGKGKGLFDGLFNMAKKEMKNSSIKVLRGYQVRPDCFEQLIPYLQTTV
eukprot:Nk52_evm56s252 gene=Nk52_evmTU56s252